MQNRPTGQKTAPGILVEVNMTRVHLHQFEMKSGTVKKGKQFFGQLWLE